MKADRNAAVIGLFAVLVVVGGIAFWNYRNSIVDQKAAAPATQAPAPALSFQDQKITVSTKPYQISVTYPSVTAMTGFNSEVLNTVNTAVAQFKSDSMANDALRKKYDAADYAKNPPTYTLNMGYDKGELNQTTASIVLTEDEFTGGANDAYNYLPVNYNVKTGKDIQLADLFPGNPDYLKGISTYCEKDLTSQVTAAMGDTSSAWIEQGASAQASNFAIFLVNNGSVTFYFPPAQVAPAAAGVFKVTMPLTPAAQ